MLMGRTAFRVAKATWPGPPVQSAAAVTAIPPVAPCVARGAAALESAAGTLDGWRRAADRVESATRRDVAVRGAKHFGLAARVGGVHGAARSLGAIDDPRAGRERNVDDARGAR